jgi:surface antigen
MPRCIIRPLLVAALLTGTPAVGWSNSGLLWLHDSPVRYFNDADWEMARETVRAALNEAADGETREWSNEKTGHHGSATPKSTSDETGVTCRDLQIRNHANRMDGGGVFPFCRQPDGKWQLKQN